MIRCTSKIMSFICLLALMLIMYNLCVQAMAEESGDGEKAKVLQDQLNELEERAEALDRQRTKNISAIRSETHIQYYNYSSQPLNCLEFVNVFNVFEKCLSCSPWLKFLIKTL